MLLVCGAARRRWCRLAGGGSRPLKATVVSLYSAALPCPALAVHTLPGKLHGPWRGRKPVFEVLAVWWASSLLGRFRARWEWPVGAWLSPSHGKSKRVAPPVGLGVVGRCRPLPRIRAVAVAARSARP